MKNRTLIGMLMLGCVFLGPAHGSAQVITGGEEVYRVVEGDSLLLISAKTGVAADWIARWNAIDPEQPLLPGRELRINRRKIAPRTVEQGIVIDIPGRMLYYFKRGALDMSFPVGLGMAEWQTLTRWRTPTGHFLITAKEQDPVWYVPESIQWKMQVQDMPVYTTMPPGPQNPLGRYVLYTSVKGICIHETIWPTTVYEFRSHGCIRVLPQNIESFYKAIEPDTPGELVYEPVKAAVGSGGDIYLQADPDIYDKAGDPMEAAMQRIVELGAADKVDWDKVQQTVDDEYGIAEDVTWRLELLPCH